MKRSLSLVLALAMTVTGLPGGLHSTGRAKAAEEIGKLAELTFDDAQQKQENQKKSGERGHENRRE